MSQLGEGGPPAIEAWITQQLDPASIDESGNVTLNNLLATVPVPASEYDLSSLQDLTRYQVVRALYSERQLQEQLTDFWENHFHTQFLKTKGFFGGTEQTAAYLEFRENELLREGALGRFEDLLVTSATSPTMLIFLDSIVNVDTAPNENYARELVELHTMGVDNGYTEADIEEIAP